MIVLLAYGLVCWVVITLPSAIIMAILDRWFPLGGQADQQQPRDEDAEWLGCALPGGLIDHHHDERDRSFRSRNHG